jgi:mono/diheme cytochrome c family protein
MRRFVLVLLLVSWFVAAQQAKTQGHPTSARASGKALFRQYCASCHGDDGKERDRRRSRSKFSLRT